ncbi:MAG TPA: TetR family transcriptional regulator [Acidimicrobiales bacterium]
MATRGGQGAKGHQSGGGLSRGQVLDAAMQILETEGIDRLTVRGLAGKLGVAATAIYWHVGDKQALLDGLAERVIAQLGDVRVRGRDPVARISSVARSLRATLLQRTELVALVHRQGRTAALFQPARRVLVRELTAAGVGGADAALGVQAVLNLVVGSVLLDRQVERQPTQRQTPEELWSRADVADAPALLEHLSHPIDEEELFDYTLAVVVNAILHP